MRQSGQTKIAQFIICSAVLLIISCISFLAWAFLTEEKTYLSWRWADDGSICEPVDWKAEPAFPKTWPKIMHDGVHHTVPYAAFLSPDSKLNPKQGALVTLTVDKQIRIGNIGWARVHVPRLQEQVVTYRDADGRTLDRKGNDTMLIEQQISYHLMQASPATEKA